MKLFADTYDFLDDWLGGTAGEVTWAPPAADGVTLVTGGGIS